MKKFLMSSVAAVAFAGSASAADLPYKAAPITAATWTGVYVNLGAGYGMWTADTTGIGGAPALPLTTVQGGRGWTARFGIGYDYQFAPSFVAGIFADYDASRIKGSIQDQQPFAVADATQNYSWAVGARLGYLITPQILSYFNGGYSSAHFTTGTAMINAGGAAPFTYNSNTFSGWFIGGGAEIMFQPGWYWRNEYRVASYGTKNFVPSSTVAGQNTITFKPYVQTATTSIVWKFSSR